MPNYKAGPGRRSKGARKPFMTRLPRDVADLVEAEAEARGLSYSEYLAVITAQALNFDVELPARKKPVSEQPTLDDAVGETLSKSA